MGLFSKSNNDAFLGIDIGANGIKLVELHKQKGRPVLWTYAIADDNLSIHDDAVNAERDTGGPLAPADRHQGEIVYETGKIDYYANLLRVVLKQAKVTTNKATASMPVSQVFHAVITLPTVPEKELDHHVRAKVKKMLSRPIEDMQVVHQQIPHPDGARAKYIRILVTAAPKDVVSFYSQVFARAGLQLTELETEAFALERSLVGNDPSTVLIADIGAERTNIFIVDEGVPVSQRSLHLGGAAIDVRMNDILRVDMDIAKQMKHDISALPDNSFPQELFSPMINPIVKELQYSLELFQSQSGNEQKRLEKIILTGGGAQFSPLIAAVKEAFPVRVFLGNPWARVVHQQGITRVLDVFAARMGVSIGLALRNLV